MSVLELFFEEDLADQLKAKFSALEQGDLHEDVLDELQALQLSRIRTRFLRQEATDGSTWPVSFAAIRRRGNGGTLFDKGTLFHSIQAALPEELERTISTDVPYGVYHQLGTGKLPKREFLGFSEDDIDLIQKLALTRWAESLK